MQRINDRRLVEKRQKQSDAEALSAVGNAAT